MGIQKIRLSLLTSQSVQDQEIAAGVAWYDASPNDAIARLWQAINKDSAEGLRTATREELQVICAMACIGFVSVEKAYWEQT